MNWRKGITRLVIVVAVPWFTYWGDAYYDANKEVSFYTSARDVPPVDQAAFNADLATMPEGTRQQLFAEARASRERMRQMAIDSLPDAQADLDRAEQMLIVCPMLAGLAAGALSFVILGFRSGSRPSPATP